MESVSDELRVAFMRDGIICRNTQLLHELLETHPTLRLLFSSDPTCFKRALTNEDQRTAIVRLLIQYGFDVNVDLNHNSPLSMAIGEGCIESARLLLKAGADPNRERCLIAAINCSNPDLRLACVKLLIEHGIDVNQQFELFSTGSYFTALDWAKDPAVQALLRQHGAKTVSEMDDDVVLATVVMEETASHFELARRESIAYFESQFGEADSNQLVETLPSGFPIQVHIIRPKGERRHYTLFTTGLSARPMIVPTDSDAWKYAELYMQLPGDWPVDDVENELWNWPMQWLMRIGQYPHDNNTWLGGGFTIIANEEPPKSFAPNTTLSCLMLLADREFRRTDGVHVHLWRVSPIYSAERELELREGVPALMRAFDRASVPFLVDIHRPPVA